MPTIIRSMSPLLAKVICIFTTVMTSLGAIQFANPVVKSTGTTGTYGLAAVDWNRDGRLDLITTHPDPEPGATTGSIRVLLGNPDGTFANATEITVAAGAHAISIEDFNGQAGVIASSAFFDIAAPAYYAGNVGVFEQSYGAVTALSQSPYAVGSNPMAILTGQFNNLSEFRQDPQNPTSPRRFRLDLVVLNKGGNSVSVLLGSGGESPNDGPRTFQSAGTFPVGGIAPEGMCAADFNKDGNLDIVTSNGGAGTISLLLGTGTGSFEAPIIVPAGSEPAAIQAADLNADGNQDVIVTCPVENLVRVFLGSPNGTLTQWYAYPVGDGRYPKGLTLADFDQDGYLDFVTANKNSGTLTIYRGHHITVFAESYEIPGTIGSLNVVTGDFNGDNYPDIATGNYVSSGSVSIILNTAAPIYSDLNANSGFPGGNAFDFSTTRFDAHGAIGPTHLVQSINQQIGIFDRGGQRLRTMQQNDFFRTIFNGVTYPRNLENLGDARVIYDRHSGRFFATAMERENYTTPIMGGHVLLAVSKSSDAIDNANPLDPGWPGTHWHRYVILIGEAGKQLDFPVIAADKNGVYITANVGGPSKVTALPKGPLLNGTFNPGSITFFPSISNYKIGIHPADNFDDIPPGAPAWLLTGGSSDNKAYLWRIMWNQGAASMDSTPFAYQMDANPEPFSFAVGEGGQKGSPNNIRNWAPNPYMASAVIRNGKLWTVRSVLVNQSGGFTNPDRGGLQWFCFDVSNGIEPNWSTTRTGLIYDSSFFEHRTFFYPTLSVNGLGHMFMSFSGSSEHDYVGVFYSYLLANEPAEATAARAPILLKSGLGPMILSVAGSIEFADYSQTVVDCLDDMTFWTVQEYAYAPTALNSVLCGTWIGEVLSKRPIVNNPSGRVYRGFNGGTFLLTGTDFFDPGPSFPNRPNVTVSGGDGISNVGATVNSSTQMTVTVNVAANATLGPRHVELTNPDGQSSFVQNALTVKERPGTTISSFSGGVGGGSVDTVLAQPDGRILIGGWFTSVNGDTSRKYFARLNSDGSTDAAFNTTIDGSISAMLLQSDGRIMIAGAFTTVNGASRPKLARLNSDGTTDQTFSSPLLNHYVLSIIQSQLTGKYYIGGEFTTVAGQNRQKLARLNSDGSVDPSFIVENNYMPINGAVHALIEDPDQKLVVAGAFTTAGGAQRNRIARFNSGGSLDATFNPGYGAANTIYTVARCADGKLIIGGQFTSYNGSAANRIARLLSTGGLDASFASSGTTAGSIESVIVEPSGKLLVCGSFTSFNGPLAGRITRLLATGATDPLFAVGTGANSVVYTISQDTLGNIIVGGGFNQFNGVTKNGLVKLAGD